MALKPKSSKNSKGKTIKQTLKAKSPKRVKVVKTPRELQEREANRILNSASSNTKLPKRPRKRVSLMQEQSLLEAVIKGLQDKKASHINQLDLRELEHRIADYFIIAEAESKIQVRAIAQGVEDFALRMSKEQPYRTEGFENAEWIIVDFINIVVHIFQREARMHYQLEQLWGDAISTPIPD